MRELIENLAEKEREREWSFLIIGQFDDIQRNFMILR